MKKATPLPLLLLIMIGTALAQSTPAIDRWVIGGGGGTVTGGNVSLSSTLGQGIGGPSSGGNVVIAVGFWSGGPTEHTVYLPAVLKNLFAYAPPCGPGNHYCEDYDALENAYGPLQSGTAYSAYPDDADDYYYFALTKSAVVTVQVTGYQAEGQLIVYDEDRATIGRDWNNAGDDGVMTVSLPALAPGKYYVRVYTASEWSSTTLYTLTVMY